MIDIGLSKMALIGVVALVVIGPEKLPKVARTVGTLLGKAQRYVNDVKSEVNRSMELDELRKMKDNVESAARDVEQSVHTSAKDFEKDWSDATSSLNDTSSGSSETTSSEYDWSSQSSITPAYSHPRKNWRVKRGATPQWFKSRSGVRTKAQSGAARVARFRPKRPL
ncbi:Sec-independent protein translocase subunit TatB [Diaphorobacter sp. HDW4A]|uniref:Sec-independent protein translocase protein TatB n=1 Tax=Diaphorobacter sp. HDW4A TaxID=2714924 RepID=UPI0014084E88|nr:Sec-independent protein translocase protein TatB [Diaphorobacter sp. HDW4A]QIL81476.1 Sec-independent protein translocase subunit TatB [Diaphorobacter sp. HDW4A]